MDHTLSVVPTPVPQAGGVVPSLHTRPWMHFSQDAAPFVLCRSRAVCLRLGGAPRPAPLLSPLLPLKPRSSNTLKGGGGHQKFLQKNTSTLEYVLNSVMRIRSCFNQEITWYVWRIKSVTWGRTKLRIGDYSSCRLSDGRRPLKYLNKIQRENLKMEAVPSVNSTQGHRLSRPPGPGWVQSEKPAAGLC